MELSNTIFYLGIIAGVLPLSYLIGFLKGQQGAHRDVEANYPLPVKYVVNRKNPRIHSSRQKPKPQA